MTPSKILFYFCISFIVGIFLESIIKIPSIFIWGILIFATLIIFICLLLSILITGSRGLLSIFAELYPRIPVFYAVAPSF